MVKRADEDESLKRFSEISQFFKKGTARHQRPRVPARLFGRKEKTNARIEVFLLRELNKEENIWDVIVDPARKVRIGNKIFFDEGKLWCEVIDNTTSRGRTVRFNVHGDFFKIIDRIGKMPLPYYIKREPTEKDKETYQTVFAWGRRGGRGADCRAPLHETPPEEDREQGGQDRAGAPACRARFVQSRRGGRPDEAQDGLRVLRDP
jgi:S-adenosylmethionine:tRNA ribosyltransferase-isomerase